MQHLQPNTLLQGGRYKIARFISSGGFGCTYEAEHVMLHKKVAIKEFFVKDFCNRDETTSQITVGITSKTALVSKLKIKFIAEAQSLCSLEHPNIVHVFDVFEENGTAYYVMDYIDGLSLNDLVKNNGPMAEQKAVGYIMQVADALKYVHSQNRLHLDIKPGNIMVDENDKAVLIDFGASKQYDEEGGENTSTLLGKTPGYAPLEQMGNDVVKFLPSTDIYALGATLYKLLTGNTPPSASLLASGETLDAIPSSISEETRNAIIKSMQTNKMKRPQSIGEFEKLLSVEGDDSTMFDAADDDEGTIFEEKPVKFQKEHKKKSEKQPAPVPAEEHTDKIDKNGGRQTEMTYDLAELFLETLPKEKFGFWLKLFLFVICASGIVSLLASVQGYNDAVNSYGSEAMAIGDVIIGAMQCVLCFVTLMAFIKRKPDAVFLAKLCLIIPFCINLLIMLTANYEDAGIGSMQQVVKSLVNGIVWFVYLCVSKRVKAIFPPQYRKQSKKVYIICAAFAIFAIYLFAASQIETEVTTSQVANEVLEYNGEPVIYSGEMRDSLPNGYGTAQYPRGRYEGTFVDGARHGKGTFTDTDGGVFTGTFANNDFDQGKYVQKDGTYYEGTFQDQQPYNGTWYEKDGTVIVNVVNGKEVIQTTQQTPSSSQKSSKKQKSNNVKPKEGKSQSETEFKATGNDWYY